MTDGDVLKLCCPACRVKLCKDNDQLLCPSCGRFAKLDGRVIDVSDMTPTIPFRVNDLLHQMYRTSGEVEEDLPQHNWRIRRALKMVGEYAAKRGTCVEIGPADGPMTTGVESLIERVFTMDISLPFAKRTENRTRKAYCLVGDALFLPFGDGTVDFVICTEVLEHVIAPLQLLMEICRILSPEGLCYLTVPNEMMRIFSKVRMKDAMRNFNPHITFFDPHSLQKLLLSSGCKAVHIKTLVGPLFRKRLPLILLEYLLYRGSSGSVIECVIKPASQSHIAPENNRK